MKSWTSFLKDPSDALCIVCKHINSGHQVSHKNIGGPELDGKQAIKFSSDIWKRVGKSLCDEGISMIFEGLESTSFDSDIKAVKHN